MTTRRSPEDIVDAWLEEGPNVLPASARRAIVVAARTTPQARPGLFGSRFAFPVTVWRAVAAAVAVVIVVGLAIGVVGPRLGGTGSTPSPVPSPSPSPSPTVVASPSLSATVPFSSSRFAYAAAYPGGWTAAPATADWPGTQLSPDPRGANVDDFTAPGGGAWIFVSSRSLAATETAESMISAVNRANAGACDSSNSVALTIGGMAWQATDLFCDGPIQIGVRRDHYIEIFVVHGGRAYFVDLISPDNRAITADDRAAYLGFVASFRFGS